MFDKELVLDILNNISWSIEQIKKRFKTISLSNDFIKDDTGLEKLDSICMQLINIGEALKQIDKITNDELLSRFSDVDWKRAKGMRDFITHHYFDIDHELVFSVCRDHIPQMDTAIKKILTSLKQ